METPKKEVSQIQKAAFVLSIIGIFIPIIPVMAIVFSGLTLKEKPNNWRAKWALGLGIIGLVTSLFIGFIMISYLVYAIFNSALGSL